MVRQKRIGVLGGTFDPIHLGHLIIAQYALEAASLDRVIFIPAGRPYMKKRAISSAIDRLTMVELAIKDGRRFESSDVDINRAGPTYTIDTLKELRAKSGMTTELFLIIGADSVAELPRWHKLKELIAMCTILAFARPGVKMEIAPEIRNKIRLVRAPLIDISATEIRKRAKAGKEIRYIVPEQVRNYIKKRGLYKKNGKS